ncbi:MAG: recombination mediator RecR [bacterium]|nr:recombination mediator RecR [bacterium]
MPPNLKSPALEEVVKRLSKLPGIGKKAALRMAVHLLETPIDDVEALAEAIRNVKRKIGFCSICGNWTERDPCPICDSLQRDSSLLCVIETPADLMAVEQSGFRGLYHVLGGALSPLDDIGPEQLSFRALMHRIEQGKFLEIIAAMNPTAEGDATAMYLARLVAPLNIKVTRIGFGLPIGSDLRLADEETLSYSLKGRREL